MALAPEVPQLLSAVFNYRERGSITLTNYMREAHALWVEVKILSVGKIPYLNLKYNPFRGNYGGYSVMFKDAVWKSGDLNHTTQTIFEFRNEESNVLMYMGAYQEILAQALVTIANGHAIPLFLTDRHIATTIGCIPNVIKVSSTPDVAFTITVFWYGFVELDGLEYPAPHVPSEGSHVSAQDKRIPDLKNPSDPFQGSPPSSPRDPLRNPLDYRRAPTGAAVNYYVVGTFFNGQGQAVGVDGRTNPGFAFSSVIQPEAMTLTKVSCSIDPTKGEICFYESSSGYRTPAGTNTAPSLIHD